MDKLGLELDRRPVQHSRHLPLVVLLQPSRKSSVWRSCHRNCWAHSAQLPKLYYRKATSRLRVLHTGVATYFIKPTLGERRHTLRHLQVQYLHQRVRWDEMCLLQDFSSAKLSIGCRLGENLVSLTAPTHDSYWPENVLAELHSSNEIAPILRVFSL